MMSCIWASALPENEPAMPGTKTQRRQNPAVSARAIQPARRNYFFEYSCLRILSRVMKPSIGRVNCNTIKAMDTVLNLLYIGA